MFAWTKPPMLPTTTASVDAYIDRAAPGARARLLAAYPGYPRRRALIDFGSDVMFGAPTWAFADAYSAHAPTYVSDDWLKRFESFGKEGPKAGQVGELDDSIGTVMKKLRELNLEEETLIFLLTDNGGSGKKPLVRRM